MTMSMSQAVTFFILFISWSFLPGILVFFFPRALYRLPPPFPTKCKALTIESGFTLKEKVTPETVYFLKLRPSPLKGLRHAILASFKKAKKFLGIN